MKRKVRVEIFGSDKKFVGRVNRRRFERIVQCMERGEPLDPVQRAYAIEALRRVAAGIRDKVPRRGAPGRRVNPFDVQARLAAGESKQEVAEDFCVDVSTINKKLAEISPHKKPRKARRNPAE